MTRPGRVRQTGGMISELALSVAFLAIGPAAEAEWAAPDFVSARIREDIAVSAEDRQAVESIERQRRKLFDRTKAELEQVESALPRIESGTIEPGVDRLKKPAADAAGNWHFATFAAKAATISAYHARLESLKKRLERYAFDPRFTTPFVGRPETDTIGYLPPVRVIHVMTEIEILADGGPAGLLWIQGIDAREIADNQALALPPWIFYVDGPRCYVDGLGRRPTVLLIRRFDLGRFLE